MLRHPPSISRTATPFPYPTLFQSRKRRLGQGGPMADTPLLKLGTRRSPLAMAQAEEARARLCAAHGWPAEAVELVPVVAGGDKVQDRPLAERSEEHTSELQSLMRISYAVFCLKKKKIKPKAR